jgi:hypothetical protein
MEEVNEVRFNAVDKHLESVDKTLDRIASTFEKITELVTRTDERMIAHSTADDLVHAVVANHATQLISVVEKLGPLVEMRRWIITAAIGIMGIFATAGTTLYVNYTGRIADRAEAAKAAAALPIAADKVEKVLVTPQLERAKSIRNRDKK